MFRDQLAFDFSLYCQTGAKYTSRATRPALRRRLDRTVGARIGLADRLAGSMLGAARVALVAATLVLVFDRIIPPERQPAFLRGSQLQPILLTLGQQGLRSLPPDVTAFIDQLKKERRI